VRCVILCGGKGTRLMPLTKDIRKAFLPLGKKRCVDHIIDRLPPDLPYSINLNDGGAIAALAEVAKGDEPLMVVCGDNYFSEGLANFSSAFKVETLIGVSEVESTERARQFGVVELSPNDGRIKSLVEKPAHPPTKLVSAGLYIFPVHVFGYINNLAMFTPTGNLGTVIRHIIAIRPVYGFRLPGAWIDIGAHEGYNSAVMFVNALQMKRPVPGPNPSGCRPITG